MSTAHHGDTFKIPRFLRSFPHIYVILFALIALAALATHVIPAGNFDRVPGPHGRQTIDPESFQFVAPSPVGIKEFMLAVPNGLVDSALVVFFVFIIGGVFMVLRRTGIIDIAVSRLSHAFARRSLLLIPSLMVVFAAIATIIGTPELAMVYVPIILPLMIALGYDSMTAVAVALCATGLGYTAGVFNPLNVGLAQTLAGLELYSGYGVRLSILIVLLATSAIFIMRYAHKVQKNADAGLLSDMSEERDKLETYSKIGHTKILTASPRQRIAAVVALAFFAFLIYGVTTQGWYMKEIAGLFLIMGIVVGILAGLNGAEISDAFTAGCREVLVGAMVAGIARGVAVMLESGNILDTIVHALGETVGDLPPLFSAIGMYLSQLGINFVIPSGSGQALVTMPIMAPLSDLVGVTRQTAVLAYQLGDGMSNILYPTAGYFMATLGVAGVPWQKWVRFFLPLFGLWVVISILFLIVTQHVQWPG